MAAPVLMPVRKALLLSAWPAAEATPASEVPSATFRLQFRNGFGFRDARSLVPFLHRLGITHIYASPLFRAREGSEHGYDIIDPLALDPQLGTENEFRQFVAGLKRRGMGLILDIVPNHMAAAAGNEWWEDVLEDGAGSRFAHFFDIDWDAAAARLVLPVLGDTCERVLEGGELKAGLDRRGFHVRYWEHRFPLRIESYEAILSSRLSGGRSAPGLDTFAALELARILRLIERFLRMPANSRLLLKHAIKQRLWEAYLAQPGLRRWIDSNLEALRSAPDADGRCGLNQILFEQNYVLAYWKAARHDVNYRRFFDINELVALRAEDDDVFDATHAFITRLVRDGDVSGVRVDHIDGLYDPEEYLRRLRGRLLTAGAGREPYVVAEKVLVGTETLPRNWEVCGTTGYDFLNAVNAVFVDGRNLGRLESIYADFTGMRTGFAELVYAQKKRIICDLFSGDLRRLAVRLKALAAPHVPEAAETDLAAAIEEVTARLGVYRTYINSRRAPASERQAIDAAFRAVSARPGIPAPVLGFLRHVLLMELPAGASPAEPQEWLSFVMRWQQFSGPITAKAVEDTAYYVYNRLISLNVIGGTLQPASAQEFHRFNRRRLEDWPHSMNATSTHDTKRSEDVRARINVLSEMPELWRDCLERWSTANARHKTVIGGAAAPSPNDEILLYQVLLGAWPLFEAEIPEFRGRLHKFAIKAAREAKIHTNWISPEPGYEGALGRFIDGILDDVDGFLPDFLSVEARIAPFGAAGSLAQSLLKITSPGVPDFYQGTFLWDYSLVDPDNRRPVDFSRQASLFRGFDGPAPDTRELVENWKDGRVKLYTIAKALEFRRVHRDVFHSGDYLPVEVYGPAAGHVIAFARRAGEDWAVTAVPRLLAEVCGSRPSFACAEAWDGTCIRLPGAAPRIWRNVFTGEPLEGGALPVGRLFGRFPVALLGNRTPGTVKRRRNGLPREDA